MRRFSVLVLTLSAAGLTACASLFGGEEVKVRPISSMSGLSSEPRDPLYESAVTAINERDYARALDYLQEAKAKDPRNIKALNALGVVYDKLGRFDLSARYYAQAREIDPTSRIVVANLDYSRALQGLMTPNTQVARLELPADFNRDTTTKPTVLASVPPTNIITASKPVESAPIASATPPAVQAMDAAATVKTSPQLVAAAPKQALEPKRVVPIAPDFGAVTSKAMLLNANLNVQPTTTVSAKQPIAKPALVATSPLEVAIAAKVPAAVHGASAAALPLPSAAPSIVQAAKVAVIKSVAAEPAVPAISPLYPRRVVPVMGAGKKVFFIGQPVRLMNASGKPDRVGIVSRRLDALGWTIRQADAGRIQPVTTLVYSIKNAGAAKAMQRTLPFPIRLVAEKGATGMRLVIGRDYLSWKPSNSRIRALWQKGPVIASLQKASLKGVR